MFIEPAIDDAHDAADGFPLFPGQEHDRIADGKSFILGRVEIFPFVHIDGRSPLGLAGVDFLGQMDEGLKVLLGNDFPDFEAHQSLLFLAESPPLSLFVQKKSIKISPPPKIFPASPRKKMEEKPIKNPVEIA
jgi:hypothetical protein